MSFYDIFQQHNNSILYNWTIYMNLTEHDDYYASPLEPWEDFVIGIFLIIINISSVVLNTLILIVAQKERKKLAIADYFIVNLAVSDIGHPLLGYPMIIIASFSNKWVFGKIGCDINGFIGFQFGVSSMSTLAVMSFIRYLTVCNPSTVKQITKCRLYIILACIHLYACIWSVSPLVGWGSYCPEPYKTSCTLDWTNPSKSFVVASFVMCLGVPVTVMAVCYGLLVKISRHQSRKMQKWKSSPKTWTRQDLFLFKMTMVMCATFVFAWLPYSLVSLVKTIDPHIRIPLRLSVFPALCAKVCHTANPCIYFLMNKKLRSYIPKWCQISKKKDHKAVRHLSPTSQVPTVHRSTTATAHRSTTGQMVSSV